MTTTDGREKMRFLAGGSFTMGSDKFYEDERPTRRVAVNPFWIDETPVTNRQFAAFVDATGYRTLAELAPDPKDYPGMDPTLAVPGSLVFERTQRPVPLDDHSQWWTFLPGADWRHPIGHDSGIDDLLDHPVVHVAYGDAEAYAAWAGKALPTEAEWEFAARGGLEGAEYAWGEELAPEGAVLANYWQGLFPFANQRADRGYRTTPVGTYVANGFGLFDMIGNVWEWTADWYATAKALKPSGAGSQRNANCCAIRNPRGGTLRGSMDALEHARIGRKVLKGGSHLCALNYCQRFRPAARHPQTIDSATSHIGFRCVVRTDENLPISP